MTTTALVGLDGSGKTTVAARVRQLGGGVTVVHAVRPHDDPDSSWADLSRHLARASAAADIVSRPQLKVALLYLQLCLFRPQEIRAAAPIVLADRHPLVDPLVYLPMYARMRIDAAPGPDVDRWWAAQPDVTVSAVQDWLRECSGTDGIWTLGTDLLELATLSPAALTAEVVRRLGVRPPDRVVLLDLPVGDALSRARARRRSQRADLHETTTALTDVRVAYEEVLSWLAESIPVHRINCAHRTVEQVTADVTDLLVTND